MSWSNYWQTPWMLFGRQSVTAHQPDSRRAAFEEFRNETLQRVDQEEREFHELMAHLRMAKDKVELNQFTT
jgi:uncharacterized protein DUF2852